MTTRKALAELVAMYDDPAKRDPEWHLRYGRVWAAAREALAQPEPEPVARDLARGLLWVAYVWNDHNFQAAHIEARKVAQRNGLHNLDEANEWLTAAPPPAHPEPEPVASAEDMYAVWLLGYKQGKDEAAAPPPPAPEHPAEAWRQFGEDFARMFPGKAEQPALSDEVLAEYTGNGEVRQWVSTGTWLMPGESVIVVRALRSQP